MEVRDVDEILTTAIRDILHPRKFTVDPFLVLSLNGTTWLPASTLLDRLTRFHPTLLQIIQACRYLQLQTTHTGHIQVPFHVQTNRVIVEPLGSDIEFTHLYNTVTALQGYPCQMYRKETVALIVADSPASGCGILRALQLVWCRSLVVHFAFIQAGEFGRVPAPTAVPVQPTVTARASNALTITKTKNGTTEPVTLIPVVPVKAQTIQTRGPDVSRAAPAVQEKPAGPAVQLCVRGSNPLVITKMGNGKTEPTGLPPETSGVAGLDHSTGEGM
jgi:hypothetical protein